MINKLVPIKALISLLFIVITFSCKDHGNKNNIAFRTSNAVSDTLTFLQGSWQFCHADYYYEIHFQEGLHERCPESFPMGIGLLPYIVKNDSIYLDSPNDEDINAKLEIISNDEFRLVFFRDDSFQKVNVIRLDSIITIPYIRTKEAFDDEKEMGKRDKYEEQYNQRRLDLDCTSN